MTHLFIRHLGGLCVNFGKRPIKIPNDFPVEVFSYLTNHPNQHVDRGVLAAEFWPDIPEKRARRALSTAMWRICSVAELAPHVVRSRHSVTFGNRRRYWIDTVAFARHIRTLKRLGKRAPGTALRRANRILRLYRGPAYAGYKSEWAINARFDLENLYCDTLFLCAGIAYEQHDCDRLCACARKLLAIEPYREDIQRLQIKQAISQGNMITAKRLYDDYAKTMKQEFGADPGFSLEDLKQETDEPTTPPPRLDTSLLPQIREVRHSLGRLEKTLGRFAGKTAHQGY